MKNQITFQNPFENVSDGVFLVILDYLQAKPEALEALQQEALTALKCSLLDQRLKRQIGESDSLTAEQSQGEVEQNA